MKSERMNGFHLEPLAAVTEAFTKTPYEAEIEHSKAISLKRIADIMEADSTERKIERESTDIEGDPLMIIARAMEEIARPTLPQESPMVPLCEREADNSERIAVALESCLGILREMQADARP